MVKITFPRDANSVPQQEIFHPSTVKVITSGGTSSTYDTPTIVRIVLSQNGYVVFKTTGTASSSDVYIPANKPEYFVIDADDFVAHLSLAAGTANVTTMI